MIVDIRGITLHVEYTLDGNKLTVRGSIGECQAIEVNPETDWRFGAADPRGDGKAAGY